MKGKKLLAAILAALMTASSASIAALAENEAPANAEQVFDNSEESVKEGSKIALFGAGVASEDVTFEVGVGKTYETLAAAMEAAATKESVIFDIYGKVVLSDSGWLLDKLTDTISVKFAGKDEDAEIDLTAETAIFGSNKTALVNVSFENLKLSHSNYAYASDYGHATNYFTTWLRGAGKDGTVTYTDCVFTNGSSNNQYGKTTYTDCTFSHTDNQYGLWIYYAENDSETTVKVDNSSFSGYKGVKLYSESKNGTGKTIIENTTFTDITNKPAVVCSVAGTVEINNVTTTNCTYGLLASELAEDRNTTFANIMVDGNKPEYAVEYATLRTSSLDYAHEEGITDEQIAEYEAMYGWYDADAAEYTLSTVNEYIGFVNIINGKATGIAQSYFRGKTVKLASDLDFQGVDFLKADADGNAISDLRATWFYGTFDGDNHTMKNINYTIVGTTSSWGIGIFRNAAGATFKNVTVDGITVESNARISFGGLVSSASGKISNIGNSFDNCHIKNIDVDVNTTNGYNGNGGGLTGYLIDGSSIKNCSVEKFDFKASNGIIAFGGLCGYFIIDGAQQRIGEVTDCTVSDFKLEAKKVGGRFGGASGNFGGVGGLLGYGHDGNSMGLPIKNCHVTGLDMTIEGGENEAYVGGFIGMTRRTYSVEDSSVKGKITASNAESNDRFYVGGFVGGAPGSDVNTTQSTSYTNCTANVDITVTGKTTAGGFAGISGNARLEGVQNWAYNAGRNAVYTNCTAKGTISSEAIAGGFAGIADRGTYTDCSASETTVTGSTAGGFIGSIERVGNGSGTGYEVTLSDCSGSTGVKFFGSASDIVTINGGVAIVNGSDIYFDFAEAIKNANDGDTVKLLSNASGDGVVIEKNITIDLGGKTYTVSGKAVGSPGYETSAFQLLADNVTIKNGTLTTAKAVTCHNNERDNYTEKANMLIQNYSSLTLDGVTLDGTNLRDTGYTLSNNKGDVEIKDSTINTNGKTFAFDIDNSRGTNQTVTVTNSTINGFVEISGNNDKEAKLLSGTNEYKEEGTYVQVGNEFIKAGKRSIEVSSDKTEVEMGDEVKISVTLKGDDITNLVYALAYDPTKFEFISATTGTAASNGSISEMLYKEDGSCYDNEAVIAEYTFKALGQTENVTADFVISNTFASTYVESIDATKVTTTNNEKASVAINLKNYEIAISVDGNATSAATLTVPYTNDGHTFTVTASPEATVSYKVNGNDADSVAVKDRGTYTIEYTITPAIGYAQIVGTFTLEIGDPEFVVEVNEDDYVAGKKIVLVYTNTDGLAFNYGDDLMIDVTSSGYMYNGTDEYSHVYAFVTNAIDMAVSIDDYKANISCLIPAPEKLIKLTYTMDLNFDGSLDVQDISTAYGIFNVHPDYFKNVKYQKNILRADTDGSKKVDNDDANAVVTAVKGN